MRTRRCWGIIANIVCPRTPNTRDWPNLMPIWDFARYVRFPWFQPRSGLSISSQSATDDPLHLNHPFSALPSKILCP